MPVPTESLSSSSSTSSSSSSDGSRAVLPHTDKEFQRFLELAAVDNSNFNNNRSSKQIKNLDPFMLKYDKEDIRVWSKVIKNDPLKIVKLRTTLAFTIEQVFDVLCDDSYRLIWDEACIKCESRYKLSNCSTVDYYAMKLPTPLSKRDVTTVRTWRQSSDSICIIGSSIISNMLPTERGFVRANGKLTGYLLERTQSNTCHFTYLSQFDPCGSIPKLVINYFTSKYMPKLIGVLTSAIDKYPKWKRASSTCDFKPWIHPHQNNLPYWASDGMNEDEEQFQDASVLGDAMDTAHTVSLNPKRFSIEYTV